MLDAPTQQHLRRLAPDPLGNSLDWLGSEVQACSQGAVGLERDTALLARHEELPPVLKRAELHLIDGWRDMPSRHHLIEVADTVVRDADRARVSELVRSLHTRPGPGRTA